MNVPRYLLAQDVHGPRFTPPKSCSKQLVSIQLRLRQASVSSFLYVESLGSVGLVLNYRVDQVVLCVCGEG